MNLQTFIVIGRSGAGKGTQAKLLRDYIQEKDTEKRNVLYVETGEMFREFIKGESFSSKLSQEIYKKGARQPDFLAVWNWVRILVDHMTEQDHLIFDGTPRSRQEATILDSALKFYKREKMVVIYISVGRDWSKQHLHARGRIDDKTTEEIENRLNWFDTDVMPAVEYYNLDPEYDFLEINGEQSIEKVHHDILTALYDHIK